MVSSKSAVAMLVLLAGAARTGFVARNFAPCGLVVRIAILRIDHKGRRISRTFLEIILTGGAVDMLAVHIRKLWRRGVSRLAHDLDPHQLAGDRTQNSGVERLDQSEPTTASGTRRD